MLYIIDISCHKSVFPLDNVHASPGKKKPANVKKFFNDHKASKCLKTILCDFGCSESFETVEELQEHMQTVHKW